MERNKFTFHHYNCLFLWAKILQLDFGPSKFKEEIKLYFVQIILMVTVKYCLNASTHDILPLPTEGQISF